LLAGRPVLFHSIATFARAGAETILVLPACMREYWDAQADTHGLSVTVIVTDGGETRTRSVRQGLSQLSGKGCVAVHDGARPLASLALAERVFTEAERHGSAVPVVPVEQALRIVDGPRSRAVDRTRFRLVQTPQGFDTERLKAAYDMAGAGDFADDAAVWEHAGHRVHLVEGERHNIKLTAPGDLELAETLYRGLHV
jgi:2-C-methyl-D-erythritol 4-phosphate cytidylyltransferase